MKLDGGLESPMAGGSFTEHLLCFGYCPVEAGVTGSVLLWENHGGGRLSLYPSGVPSVGPRLWWHLRIVVTWLVSDFEA